MFVRLGWKSLSGTNTLAYCSNLPSLQGKFNVINISLVIYRHSTVINKVMLLYNNTERWYDHRMAVNYGPKKFYNIGPGANVIKLFLSVIYEFS